ncbi:MAG: EamA family transporter [Candidatus Micrarchaeota archaeon]
MELWIIFSLLATLCWSISNVFEKYVLTKWVRNPLVITLVLGIVGLLAALGIIAFHGVVWLPFAFAALAIAAGVFGILGALFYFTAVKEEEISRVVPLAYLTPILIVLPAAFFLGEVFTLATYAGIFLLTMGAVLVSQKDVSKPHLGKAFWLMILSNATFAVDNLLCKYLLGYADVWSIWVYVRIGSALALIPVVYFHGNELVEIAREHGKKSLALIFANESISILGGFLFTIATAMGYVTLVSALGSLQPFVVLLFTLVLSRLAPEVLSEKTDKSTVLLKLAAIVMIFIGAMLII